MTRTALAFVAALAAGCTTNPDGTTSLGAPGSTDWTLTASHDTKVAFYRARCESYGYTTSGPLSQCVGDYYRDAENRASDEMAQAVAIGAASYAATRPVRVQTTCTTYGHQTNCY
jgi:hypothetical protein